MLHIHHVRQNKWQELQVEGRLERKQPLENGFIVGQQQQQQQQQQLATKSLFLSGKL